MLSESRESLRQYFTRASAEDCLAVLQSLKGILEHCLGEMEKSPKKKNSAESIAIWAGITLVQVMGTGESLSAIAEKMDGTAPPGFPSDRVYGEKALKRHYNKAKKGVPPLFEARCKMAIGRAQFKVDADKVERQRRDAKRKKQSRNKEDLQNYLDSLSGVEYSELIVTVGRRDLGRLWLEQDFHWEEWSERKRSTWTERLNETLALYIRYSGDSGHLAGKPREYRQQWLDNLKAELLTEIFEMDRFFSQF